MKKMLKNKSNDNWRSTYIDILRNGPQEENLKEAKQLIDKGYATGSIHMMADRSFIIQAWMGITLDGERFLEDLETQEYKASVKYRILLFIGAFASWFVGMLSSIFLEIYKCT